VGSDKENAEAAYYGMEQGTVTANADPKLLGRVKIRIPGVIDETDWAFPINGGGSAQRGRWQVPKVGADVSVWFHRGDPHGHVFFAPGHWGLPGGASEAPTFIAKDPTVTAATAPLLAGLEDDRYYVVIDSRPGKEAARLVDKLTGDKFELDGRRYRATIQVTGTLSITAGAIEMTAGRILLNGRPVTPFGGPIG
jgi:Type VI secretion system/phage-baseplate injector OB domain